jgi:uncharacterized protein (TIGR03066 family)
MMRIAITYIFAAALIAVSIACGGDESANVNKTPTPTNEDKIVGYWKINDIDDGRAIPADDKAAILSKIRGNGYIDIRKNRSVEMKMGESTARGTWILNDNYTKLQITKDGQTKSESLTIKQLDDTSLILEQKVKDRIFRIVLAKDR